MINEHEIKIAELQRGQKEIEKAFVKNDLGLPSFDAHRLEHIRSVKQSEQMDSYKAGMTKTVLDWFVKGVLAIVVAGVIALASKNFL